MLRVISERTSDIDEELCACFIDWQKAFDRVNWSKLMQIIKEVILNGAKEDCTWLRSKISVTKAAFNNKKTFHQQIGLKLKEETSNRATLGA
jgi:hypothetical protein